MKNAIKKFWDSEDGMGVVEVVLITIVLVGLGGRDDAYSKVPGREITPLICP